MNRAAIWNSNVMEKQEANTLLFGSFYKNKSIKKHRLKENVTPVSFFERNCGPLTEPFQSFWCRPSLIDFSKCFAIFWENLAKTRKKKVLQKLLRVLEYIKSASCYFFYITFLRLGHDLKNNQKVYRNIYSMYRS